MSTETLDTEIVGSDEGKAEAMPLATRPGDKIVPLAPGAPRTAAQAKIEAVADLTSKAYEKASTLKLRDSERESLCAEFPDECFQPGAAGKENLIYIEHSALRDRLNKSLGAGQWAIIPRNRWSEEFEYFDKGSKTHEKAVRVYVEAMLLIRGCFVGEAVGDCVYYPKNQQMNYGDAVEGAKTQALRRCCKELGVGLQAWSKDWCMGWWARKNSGKRTLPRPPTPPHNPPASPPPPAPLTPLFPTEAYRARMIESLKASPGQPNRDVVTEFFQKADCILPTESLEDLPLKFVPVTPAEMRDLGASIAGFGNGESATLPYKPHVEPAGTKIKPKASVPEPEPEPEAESDPGETSGAEEDTRQRITGTVEIVTTKNGTSKKGPWTLYGIKIAGQWFNTFDSTLGTDAKAQTGQEITLAFTKTERGNTAEEIIAS